MFDPNDADSIRTSQDLMTSDQLFNDLIFIQNHFEDLIYILAKLEKKELPLFESLGLFNEVKNIILNTPGDFGKALQSKMDAILIRNPDFHVLEKINIFLTNSNNNENIPSVQKQNILYYKYAPITSCDVERSFSAYKNIFSEKRQNLKVENLEKLLITYCNNNYN